MESYILVCCTVMLALLHEANTLKCYACVSSQPGCGKELNIRLQRKIKCPGTDGENFCVKITEKRGSEEFLTRHCLQNLRDYTSHRRAMPTVMRHGYCNAARTGDAYNPWNQDMVYCFCNDWNGCNSAPGLGRHGWSAVVFATTGLILTRLCL